MIRAAASLLAPPLCAICGEVCAARSPVCDVCGRSLRRSTPRRELLGGVDLVTATPYEGAARDLVHRLKFAGRVQVAEVAAEMMVRAIGATRRGVLVPVPPAPARYRARGHDPAATLARLVASSCPELWVAPALERDDAPRQVGRPRDERLADPPPIRLSPALVVPVSATVWIVDDVVTTGATLHACARILRGAGATDVHALAFARAEA